MSVGRLAGDESTLLTRAGFQTADLVRRRGLVVDLARAELRRENARLLLGDFWWIADPLLQMVVYTILVSVIFERAVPDYSLFVLAALIPWKGVSSSVSSGCTAITGNERIVRQLPFPRVVLPVARVASQLWRLGIALVVLVVLIVLVWPERASPALAWLPLLALVEIVFLLPFVILFSAATVFVRDLANLMRHLLRLGLYLSPVLYSLDQFSERVPGWLATVYGFNPLALLLEAFRDVAYHGVAPSPSSLLLPAGIGLTLLPFALAWFDRVEPQFGKAL